jgi:hypothetical protein
VIHGILEPGNCRLAAQATFVLRNGGRVQVFDDENAAGSEMIKEGGESNLLMLPDVGCVVDDDVEGAMLLCNAIQECSAATVANLDGDALVCVLSTVPVKITSDDLALGKIIPPNAK